MTDQERINALEERVRNLEGLMATALQQSCAPDMTRNIDLSLRPTLDSLSMNVERGWLSLLRNTVTL